jgi:hypothetical protein
MSHLFARELDMKIFLAIAAVLAWLFGLMLFLAPTQFYAPVGIVMTPMLATVAQAHGATLIGVGTVNWLARHAQGRGLVAVLVGNLVIQILSFVVAVRTSMLGAGASATPAFVIHLLLGAGFAVFLVRVRRGAVMANPSLAREPR